MSKYKRKTFSKKSHSGRNISIIALLVAIGVIAVALSGALSPAQTFTILIHVYDRSKAADPESVTSLDQLVANATISVSGPTSFTQLTPTGILRPPNPVPSGVYQITASRAGYTSASISYVVGSNCERRDSEGFCHAWLPLRPS